ncbi:MAG: hypothetical protein M3488_08110 [Actinomycetota bacterium]|nr:hypothetical protein [Actinomycetota bacterium]
MQDQWAALDDQPLSLFASLTLTVGIVVAAAPRSHGPHRDQHPGVSAEGSHGLASPL